MYQASKFGWVVGGTQSLPGKVGGGEGDILGPEMGGLEIKVKGTCCLSVPSAMGHDGCEGCVGKGQVSGMAMFQAVP